MNYQNDRHPTHLLPMGNQPKLLSGFMSRKVVEAANAHQSAYYRQDQHPMNVWMYPNQVKKLEYDRFHQNLTTQQELYGRNAPGRAGLIAPQQDALKSLHQVAEDYNGLGRIQFPSGDVFEGEFRNGKMEGKGILFTLKGDEYRGHFKNGFKHGQGLIKYANGISQYEGQWNYNKIEGAGISIDENGNKYDGEFQANMRHGKGRCYYSDGMKFEGLWNNNLPEQGLLCLANGTHFDGQWKDDKFSGVGTITYPNGDRYEGQWRENVPHRYGKMYYKAGRIFTGEWNLGDKSGNGVMEYPNGDRYEGQWLKDVRDGYGTLKLHRGDIYEGEWKHDQMDGRGHLKHYQGTSIEGVWQNGQRVDQRGQKAYSQTPMPSSEYRLKEPVFRPNFQANHERLKAIEVDQAYAQRLQTVNPQQMPSHSNLRTDRQSKELHPYLQDLPGPLVYKPTPLRQAALSSLSARSLSQGPASEHQKIQERPLGTVNPVKPINAYGQGPQLVVQSGFPNPAMDYPQSEEPESAFITQSLIDLKHNQ